GRSRNPVDRDGVPLYHAASARLSWDRRRCPPDDPDHAARSTPTPTAFIVHHGGKRPSRAALYRWCPSLRSLGCARRPCAAECVLWLRYSVSRRLVCLGVVLAGVRRHLAVLGRARRRRAVKYMLASLDWRACYDRRPHHGGP